MDQIQTNHWGAAFAAGICGAVALTAVHQLARRVTEEAPRMDILGERAIARTIEAAGGVVPDEPSLNRWALTGDLLVNSAFYSLVACGRDPHLWRRGMVMGLAAGVGALVLPRRLGLGDAPASDHLGNQMMTVVWYLIGGIAAAAAGRGLRRAPLIA